MTPETIQFVAGTISSVIFAAGTFTMLYKTLRTKNVDSLSLWFIVLNNIGNGIYWLYVLSLPFGPIYMLHAFYSVAMIIMLICFLMYRQYPEVVKRMTQTMQRIRTTQEIPRA